MYVGYKTFIVIGNSNSKNVSVLLAMSAQLVCKLLSVLLQIIHIAILIFIFQSFGPETSEIITLNLPRNASIDFSMVVKCCLCLALFFTYPGTYCHFGHK